MLAVQADGRSVLTVEGLAAATARAAPAPARVPRAPRAPVRLLHAGLPADRRGAAARAARPERARGPRGARRQPLPLHGLRGDRRTRCSTSRARERGARPTRRVTEPPTRASATPRWRAAATALEAVMAEHEVDHLLVYGANRFGSAVGWLTRWPVTREALVVVTPGERDVLLVDFYNHVPERGADRDRGRRAPRRAARASRRRSRSCARGARRAARSGSIGPLGHCGARAARRGRGRGRRPRRARTRACGSSSPPEEIDWLRVGCELTDAAVVALRDGARPGVDERELGALVEGAYVARGGTTHIHYFAATQHGRAGDGGPGAVAVGAAARGRRRADLRDQRGRGGTTRASSCARSRSPPSRRRSTASCTPSPTRRSTRRSPCCAPARPRPTSSRPRASSRTPASRRATTSCTASSAATCRRSSARRAARSRRSRTSRSRPG